MLFISIWVVLFYVFDYAGGWLASGRKVKYHSYIAANLTNYQKITSAISIAVSSGIITLFVYAIFSTGTGEKCSYCEGSGKLPCFNCSGLGQLSDGGRGCNVCNNKKKVDCSYCSGDGFIDEYDFGYKKEK